MGWGPWGVQRGEERVARAAWVSGECGLMIVIPYTWVITVGFERGFADVAVTCAMMVFGVCGNAEIGTLDKFGPTFLIETESYCELFQFRISLMHSELFNVTARDAQCALYCMFSKFDM